MKITKLLVKNIQRVRRVELIAKPGVNELAGRNEQGKTSVLDAIRMVFDGARSFTADPLRNGEAEGETVAETEEFVVQRKFRRNGASQLKITRKDGEPMGQHGLWDILGPLSFDPLAFVSMTPVQQAERLLSLMPAEVKAELDKIDDKVTEKEKTRGDIGRDLKRAGAVSVPEPVDRVDISEIAKELHAIEQRNSERDVLESERSRLTAGLEGLQVRIADARRHLAQLEHERDHLIAIADGLPPPEPKESTAALQERIAIAGARNRMADEYDAAKKKVAEQRALSEQLLDAETAIKQLKAERKKLFDSIDFGIPGIEFASDGIRVDGHPFSMLCESKKIRISARMGAKLSRGLKIMLVTGGSLLDSDSYKELCKLAEEEDLQIFLETVGSGHGEAVIIDDGMVLDADGEF